MEPRALDRDNGERETGAFWQLAPQLLPHRLCVGREPTEHGRIGVKATVLFDVASDDIQIEVEAKQERVAIDHRCKRVDDFRRGVRCDLEEQLSYITVLQLVEFDEGETIRHQLAGGGEEGTDGSRGRIDAASYLRRPSCRDNQHGAGFDLGELP